MTDKTDIIDQYTDFSTDYHWLFSDQGLRCEQVLEENRELFSSCPSSPVILDCSCGIGSFAIALARQGFHVTATDGSPGMVRQAKTAITNAAMNISTSCCTWENLPGNFPDRKFHLVFCLGNSIGHCTDSRAMIRSIQGMRAVLKPGGHLVLQSRNWEYLRREKKRLTHFSWRERNGERCLPVYVWNFPCSWNDIHTIEVILVFDRPEGPEIHTYPISYHPFSHEQLLDNIREAGFSSVESDFSPDRADYRLVSTY